MAKQKAIVITNRPSVYKDFIKSNGLNPNDYILVNDKMALYAYKDTIAFLVPGYKDIFGYDTDFNHTEALLSIHNVDTIEIRW